MSHIIFIQARMSSERLPGKMLTLFKGVPLVERVYNQCCGAAKTVILTSTDSSDDVLCDYLNEKSIPFFRGDLKNVFERFYCASKKYQKDYVVRVCGDSPFIDAELIKFMIKKSKGYDFITNVFNRTFPKGQSIEVINAKAFNDIPADKLSSNEKEHVTAFFYNSPTLFKILSVEQTINNSDINLCVDTNSDLQRLILLDNPYTFKPEEITCKEI